MKDSIICQEIVKRRKDYLKYTQKKKYLEKNFDNAYKGKKKNKKEGTIIRI